MTIRINKSCGVALTAIGVLTAACGDASTAPGVEVSTVEATSVTALSGTVLTAVNPPPSVVVKDGAGRPVTGITVKFLVPSGGGTVTPDEAITDDKGIARVSAWVLGPSASTQPGNPNPNVLWAYTDVSESRVSFTATAQPGPPARMIVGTSLTGDTADTSPTLIGGWPVTVYVRVYDASSNFISRAPVSLTVVTGGGSVSSARAETDAFGNLTAQWVLGAPGANTLQLSSGDLYPVLLSVTALDPTQFTWYDLQTPAGCPGSILDGVIGLAASGELAVRTDYPGGGQSISLGHYAIDGSAIWLYTASYYEIGLLQGDQLILERGTCDEYTPSVWIYNKRVGSGR